MIHVIYQIRFVTLVIDQRFIILPVHISIVLQHLLCVIIASKASSAPSTQLKVKRLT